ncbi:MAG TPA: preprotein translocase subunit SecA, partial [Pseudonocardiaceae bacterium]|nr:preprotein translocase subunit SecA [Pseudonocardiaceae bacterium]
REREIESMVGEGAMRELERRVVLSVLDRKWREHLYEMDYLKEGIGLRAMAQRDPLVEYQREGFDMFNAMLDALREESVGFLFNLQVEPAPAPDTSAQPAVGEIPVAAGNSNGNGQQPGRRRRPEAPPQPAAVDGNVPPALRGKGLGSQATGQQPLTYSGPAEDGNVQSSRTAKSEDAAGGNNTRRERREQARQAAKASKRPRR